MGELFRLQELQSVYLRPTDQAKLILEEISNLILFEKKFLFSFIYMSGDIQVCRYYTDGIRSPVCTDTTLNPKKKY